MARDVTIGLGTVLVAIPPLVVGAILYASCTSHSSWPTEACVDYGYRPVALPLLVFAAVAAVAGVVIAVAARPPAPRSPLPPGPGTCFCPACGQPLVWVAPYARWYCYACGRYR